MSKEELEKENETLKNLLQMILNMEWDKDSLQDAQNLIKETLDQQ